MPVVFSIRQNYRRSLKVIVQWICKEILSIRSFFKEDQALVVLNRAFYLISVYDYSLYL